MPAHRQNCLRKRWKRTSRRARLFIREVIGYRRAEIRGAVRDHNRLRGGGSRWDRGLPADPAPSDPRATDKRTPTQRLELKRISRDFDVRVWRCRASTRNNRTAVSMEAFKESGRSSTVGRAVRAAARGCGGAGLRLNAASSAAAHRRAVMLKNRNGILRKIGSPTSEIQQFCEGWQGRI